MVALLLQQLSETAQMVSLLLQQLSETTVTVPCVLMRNRKMGKLYTFL